MPAFRQRRRFVSRPELEARTGLVPLAVAGRVVEEASVWLGVPLPSRYVAGLVHRAGRCYAHSPTFRGRVDRRGEAGRETLYVFMRHWLAARLKSERPALFARLPESFCTGEGLPAPTRPWRPVALSNEARLLAGLGL